MCMPAATFDSEEVRKPRSTNYCCAGCKGEITRTVRRGLWSSEFEKQPECNPLVAFDKRTQSKEVVCEVCLGTHPLYRGQKGSRLADLRNADFRQHLLDRRREVEPAACFCPTLLSFVKEAEQLLPRPVGRVQQVA
jgi:hypothetical protein